MTSRVDIEARVQAFVADLEGLVRVAALEAVQKALGEGGGTGRGKKAAGAAPAAGGAPKAKARKKGQKRTPEELEALEGQLDAFVNANPGQRIEEIGKALGIATSELTRPMKKLLEGGKVRSTGQRRATKYFPGKKK